MVAVLDRTGVIGTDCAELLPEEIDVVVDILKGVEDVAEDGPPILKPQLACQDRFLRGSPSCFWLAEVDCVFRPSVLADWALWTLVVVEFCLRRGTGGAGSLGGPGVEGGGQYWCTDAAEDELVDVDGEREGSVVLCLEEEKSLGS